MEAEIKSICSNNEDITDKIISEFEKELEDWPMEHFGSPKEIILNNPKYYYKEYQRRMELRQRIKNIHESNRAAANAEMKSGIEASKGVLIMIVAVILTLFLLSI